MTGLGETPDDRRGENGKASNDQSKVSVGDMTRRIEGIAIWAVPGIDPRTPDADLPDQIPDHALDRMKDRHAETVKERRSSQGRENGR